MDIQIVNYCHEIHYPIFWPIFRDYWRDVNHKNLERMKNIIVDGKTYVTSELEEKLMAICHEKRIKIAIEGGKVIGFIQYRPFSGSILHVESLYVTMKSRLHGVSRALINTFPEVSCILFHVHRDNPPKTLLRGFSSARKLADAGERDLELWMAEYQPEIQGRNQAVVDIKNEARRKIRA